ncbi:MAG: hypothetical protein PCFJNLEI_01195 [Verrucomicrobiae bacterium]|nr:hypothetical protein [Verrucomicrobiae bacterium]
MTNRIVSSVLLGVAFTAAGCSSLRPLTSRPPATVIRLACPVIIPGAFGSETILPAGEYRASLEDEKGYYYAAPAKLILNDGVARQLDGGLYLRKDSTALTHYYIVGQKHATIVNPLKVPVRYETRP